MKSWHIREISNGYVVTLPNGFEVFYDEWRAAVERLKRSPP